jgi:3'(2'), 5'-bisphosphate nucleotidase
MADRFELTYIAIRAATEAGMEILTVYGKDDFSISVKQDHSPLTEADLRSNSAILTRLQPTHIPVLSEESSQAPYEERKNWKQCWIVDPLDGTKEFIRRNGEFTVNIALIEEGTPVLGVIYTPVTGELFYGIVGVGAWKVIIPGIDDLAHTFEALLAQSVTLPIADVNREGLTVVASRSHMTPETSDYLTELERMVTPVNVLSRGSSLKICMVAEGVADIYPRFAPTMEWDTAAGDAIARSAGCQVINAKTGDELTYNKPELLNPWFMVKRIGGLTF